MQDGKRVNGTGGRDKSHAGSDMLHCSLLATKTGVRAQQEM